MRFATSYAQAAHGDGIQNARIAAERIGRDLAEFLPAVVIYFASTEYDPHVLAAAMKATFPGASTLGCSTAGEAADGRIFKGSVVAMAFQAEVFDYCRFALVFEAGAPEGENVFTSADAAMEYLARDAGVRAASLDGRKFVGLALSDRITPFAERLLDRICELTDVPFLGGFAGEDVKYRDRQTVAFGGEVYRDVVLLGLWKPEKGFSLVKTQAVEPVDRVFSVTRADADKKIVWELDGQPAAGVYARAIGVKEEELGKVDMDKWLPALVSDGEYFVRPVTHIVEGGGLGMFVAVKEGSRLALTRNGDMVKSTALSLTENAAREGAPAALLHFNCVSRHAFLEGANRVDDFARLFEGVPHISFASYGEIHKCVGAMSSIMIAFK